MIHLSEQIFQAPCETNWLIFFILHQVCIHIIKVINEPNKSISQFRTGPSTRSGTICTWTLIRKQIFQKGKID